MKNRKPRENADDYHHVVLNLSNRHRIIDCHHGIQWILQRRTGGQWRGHKYIRVKDGLLTLINRTCHQQGITLTPQASSILERLPEVHPWGFADE